MAESAREAAVASRHSVDAARLNAEAAESFAVTGAERAGESDLGLTSPRASAERSRDEAEAARDHAEQARNRSEKARTRAEAARNSAETALKARDAFLADATHELRQPIHTLGLQLDALSVLTRRTGAHSDDAAHIIAEALKQGRVLARLVSDMCDVAALSSGKVTLRPTRIDLRRVVTEALAGFGVEMKGKDIPLDFADGSPVLGDWDQTRLGQVIVNLLSNAIKYGRGRGIDVAVGQNDGHAFVSVKDRGLGIPPERLKSVFDRYGRINPQDGIGGLGLGLFITKRLVDAHGGTVSVESEVGRGSTFTVRLPNAPAMA
jgi:signal transduction histidine kinase